MFKNLLIVCHLHTEHIPCLLVISSNSPLHLSCVFFFFFIVLVDDCLFVGCFISLLIWFHKLDTRQSHFGKRNFNSENASLRLTCGQAWETFPELIDVGGPSNLWTVPPLTAGCFELCKKADWESYEEEASQQLLPPALTSLHKRLWPEIHNLKGTLPCYVSFHHSALPLQ